MYHVTHALLSTLNDTDSKILESNDFFLTQTLLFGSTSFDTETSTLVLNATIGYILSIQNLACFVIFICFFHCNILFSIYFSNLSIFPSIYLSIYLSIFSYIYISIYNISIYIVYIWYSPLKDSFLK